MGWFLAFGYTAVLGGILGAIIYKKCDVLRRDAEAFRRFKADRANGRLGDPTLTNPDEMARSIEAIALEVERISEGQRFVTKLLAERPDRPEKRRAEGHVSPLSPIPGMGRS